MPVVLYKHFDCREKTLLERFHGERGYRNLALNLENSLTPSMEFETGDKTLFEIISRAFIALCIHSISAFPQAKYEDHP